MRRFVAALAGAVVAMMIGGCSKEPPPTMPDLVGKHLDVALSDVKRAGFSDDVEVLGGGTFGILDESNWTVCTQAPQAGKKITEAPRISVERKCKGIARPESTPSRAKSTAAPTQSQPPSEQQGDGSNFKFGQTAHFRSTAGSNDIPLEFTVLSPTTFTPTKDATLYDAVAEGGPWPGTRKATNVYFTVTIKNTSTTQTWETDFAFGHVHQTGDDEAISEVHDGAINGTLSLHHIPPGKSATFKDGFSVKSADTIQYELDVDGLAGKSFYWTR